MEIKIQSIHFDATEKLQAFIEKKAAKLEKSCEDLSLLEFQLKVEKPQTADNKTVAVTANLPGQKIFVEKTCDTFEEAVDLSIDALRVQIQKFKEKMRNY